eukprot:TRINITY_DN29460_c0_g1_i1.p2 TRINITY_DN29460_c0_g1~~TRINITY_DN29460_c0_g1_i1.p2  ORF type:complete len:101 (-),score=7.12 TRINITY_DN29460_c0_g1_i1:197-499(-)
MSPCAKETQNCIRLELYSSEASDAKENYGKERTAAAKADPIQNRLQMGHRQQEAAAYQLEQALQCQKRQSHWQGNITCRRCSQTPRKPPQWRQYQRHLKR